MTMLHDITGSVARYTRKTRKGKGRASGKGKTSGRGTKGCGAHGGDVAWKPGHEGGQTPLFRRWPKRGFSNKQFQTKYHVVKLESLNAFDDGATVDANTLIGAGLLPDSRQPLKILGDGSLSKKLTIVAAAFSASALEKIQSAGGTAQNVKGEAYTPRKAKKKVDPASAFARKKANAGGGKKAAAPAAEGEAKPAAEQSADKQGDKQSGEKPAAEAKGGDAKPENE